MYSYKIDTFKFKQKQKNQKTHWNSTLKDKQR